MNKAESKSRKVVYLSGSRADFGLMESTLKKLADNLEVSIAVVGMHLDSQYGLTVEEIRATGLRICGEVSVDVRTRSAESMTIAIGETIIGITPLLVREKPDLLLLLGDRGEMLAGAIAGLHLGIPTVHLHGGERTGTVDDPIRHAISKLAVYHFVASSGSRDRLVRLGEIPDQVHVTGAPGLDGLFEIASISSDSCRFALGLGKRQDFILSVFHPVVQQAEQSYDQAMALIGALWKINLPVVWLEPNSDYGSVDILRALDTKGLPIGSRRLRHLPRSLYVSAMRYAELIVGNSSSGIIEAASFGTPVVNVGDRQHLRERNLNVVDVDCNEVRIYQAIRTALAHGRWSCVNVYGDGHAGDRIVRLLCELSVSRSMLGKINTY